MYYRRKRCITLKLLPVVRKQISFIEKNFQRKLLVSICRVMVEGVLKMLLYKVSLNGIFQKVVSYFLKKKRKRYHFFFVHFVAKIKVFLLRYELSPFCFFVVHRPLLTILCYSTKNPESYCKIVLKTNKWAKERKCRNEI